MRRHRPADDADDALRTASAIHELSKGKTTTDPARHPGEGIFFTSKVVDAFGLDANGLRWTVDSLRNDQAVGLSDQIHGTLVRCELDVQLSRSTSEVFAAFSIDHDFARTRTVVQLFSIGVRFISRSEARRLLAGLDRFRDVTIVSRRTRGRPKLRRRSVPGMAEPASRCDRAPSQHGRAGGSDGASGVAGAADSIPRLTRRRTAG